MTTALYPAFASHMRTLGLEPGQQVVVALGGGVDSQSLLDLTHRWRQEHPQFAYLAIHLDHSFHPKSAAWADVLREECARYAFPAVIEPLAVPRAPRQSKEAAGREARYQRLRELTRPDAVILLGQHRNDQVETLLLQLKRGAGPAGLAAMAPVMPWHQQRRLCRPLLTVTKPELYAYARSRQLRWIEDDTNADTRIDRNFLRHEIIPPLVDRWPGFLQTASRSAELCAEQEQLLQTLVSEKLHPLVTAGRLCIRHWPHYESRLQRAMLRQWLREQQVQLPSQARLHELNRQLRAGGRVGVQWGRWQVRSFQQHVYVLPQTLPHWQATPWGGKNDCVLAPELPALQSCPAQGTPLALPANASLTVCPAWPGALFQPAGRRHPQPLSRLWKQAGVPPWARAYWPVIVYRGEIIWAASLGARSGWPRAGGPRVIYPWFPTGEHQPQQPGL